LQKHLVATSDRMFEQYLCKNSYTIYSLFSILSGVLRRNCQKSLKPACDSVKTASKDDLAIYKELRNTAASVHSKTIFR